MEIAFEAKQMVREGSPGMFQYAYGFAAGAAILGNNKARMQYLFIMQAVHRKLKVCCAQLLTDLLHRFTQANC